MHTEKKYSDGDIEAILIKETRFLNKILSLSSFPTSPPENEDEEQVINTGKGIPQPAKKCTRAKSILELQERLQAIQSKKKLTYKEKLQKKGLKNRVKRKTKQNERKAQRVKADPDEAVKKEEIAEVTKATPVFNKDDKIVYSKFEFPEGNKKKKSEQKDPKKILEKLQKQKEKLTHLEEIGQRDKATEIKEKVVWKGALAKAEGKKVKDDPALLKKSIEKRKQKRLSSKKKWQAREETVKKAQEDRQAKRNKNIEKRKKDKKVHKMKNAVKRGKVIPGY